MSNFVGNAISTLHLLYTDRNTAIDGCIFMNNYCHMFFKAGGYSFTITKCFVSLVGSFTYSAGGAISLISNTLYTQTHNIDHFITHFCFNEHKENSSTPCVTLPLPPSSCIFDASSNIGSLILLTTILSIITFPLLLS